MSTNVQPAVLQVKEPFAPPVVGPLKPSSATPEHIENEFEWLNHLRELLGKETLEKDDYLSWARFHASRQAFNSYTCNHLTSSHVFRECALCCHDSAFYECYQVGSSIHQPRTDTCHHAWTAIICCCKANSMELASITWGESVRYHARWPSHRNGCIQSSWKLVWWKWLDEYNSGCWG